MLYIEDTLVSLDVIERHFVCNLEACKGACCVEGDFGAPLLEEEKVILKEVYQDIAPYLSPEGKAVIEKRGYYEYTDENQQWSTPLMANGACVYLTYGADGIAKCGIEKAYEDGATTFKKPISCHLYPIRVSHNEITGFEAWNYDQWDICNPACIHGEELQVPIYLFLKEAIIRAKGLAFYEALEDAARHVGDQ